MVLAFAMITVLGNGGARRTPRNLPATYGFHRRSQAGRESAELPMSDSLALMKKLQLRAGMRLWLIDVPRPIAEALSAGAEVELVGPHDAFDGAIAFCRNPAEVASFAAQILPGLPEDGLLWLAYRKGAAAQESGLS